MITRWIAPSDLAVLDIDAWVLKGHLMRRLIWSGLAAVIVVTAYVVVTQRPPLPWMVLAAISMVPTSAVVLLRRCITVARQRRTDMEMAMAVLLDLVNVMLAGGAGPETALLTAAAAGDGWAFDTVRLQLSRAQQSRRPHWEALDELGERFQVAALGDVAQSLRTATVNGGRIRQSLASRADALRKSNLARVEFEAERRTERMGVPMVLMFVGFVCFIGYPAMVTTMATL